MGGLLGSAGVSYGQSSGVGSVTTTSTTSASATNAPVASSAPEAPISTPSTNAAPETSATIAPNPDSMGAVIVNGIPLEENILPTSRPVNSVYGLDLNVLDTPRAVTIVSREQLSQIDIQDARDYSKLTSDSYTESDFGTPAAPSIRGQPADVMVNGQRTGLNADGNGPPVDFNNIESVNIVKGIPDAETGSSIYVGGYVDEQTKQPYFDKFQGDAAATIGEYDQYRQTLDFGGPILANQLAYRVSYSGDESGSFYDYVHDDSQTGYVALTWIPSDKYEADFNASYGEVDYLENNGINRVTQDLIDSNTYITGSNIADQPSPHSGFFNVFDPTGTSQISDSTNVRNPNDGAYAQTANAQLIQKINVNDDFKIVNNTFYQYINWRTYNSQFYDQYTDGDYSVDNRFSVILDNDIPVIDPTKADMKDSKDLDPKSVHLKSESDPGLSFHNELNTGVEFRFQQNTDYESIASEPFNIYDLTQSSLKIFDEIPPADYGRFNVAHIPGLPQKYVFDVNGLDNGADSGKSELYETSFYAQDVLKFTPQWSLLFGGRADIFHVDAETPPGTPSDLFASDSTTQILPDFNVSLDYKPFDWMTVYATVDRGQAPGNTGQSGSFSPFLLNAGDFHQWATLYEIGAKFSILNDKLFATVAAYKENRYDPASDGGDYRQRIKGAEVDFNYQPDKHFYATASYSWAESVDVDPGFQYNTVPVNENPTFWDTPSFIQSGVDALGGTYKSPGFPVNSFNLLLVYKLDCGLGASFDAQATSPINVAWVGGVQIPWQYNMDASVFYDYKHSEVKLSVYNLTDQQNWGSVNPIYGLDSIFVSEPIHIEGTIKIHF